jgi:hypothetical protein
MPRGRRRPLRFANPGASEVQMVSAFDREQRVRPVLCLFEGVATGAARPDVTNLRPMIGPSSSAHRSEFGCELIGPRLRTKRRTMDEEP